MSSQRPSSARPADHIDSAAPDPTIVQPKLGLTGYLRFFWRQLTSMRTALFLLLLLAFAAIPGSVVPQRSSDPNGVVQFRRDNPDLFPILDGLKVFDTYTSPWFSAIYLLLFISLIGCVIPRARHHYLALRARPPRTPARLEKLPGFTTTDTDADAATIVETAREVLRSHGYRTETYGDSVSAERGYLRETGNLVFHTALIGVLVSVGIGGGFGYTGQRVVVEGQRFVNVLGDYDSFNPGRFFTDEALQPFRISLDEFTATYETEIPQAFGMVTDFTASVTTTEGGSDPKAGDIKVNSPLAIGGTEVFLLGNGYAPTITVRDPDGKIVWTDSVPFLPQDANLTSVGVVKVPDGLDEQVGMAGFFYPTVAQLESGALVSKYPDIVDPLLTLRVYTGDLGLDEGVPRSVYELAADDLTPVAGDGADEPALQLAIGQTVDLPKGLGTITLDGAKRFASFDIHHDPSQVWVFAFAMLVVLGLLTSLFIPRRRVWIKAKKNGSGWSIEYAALARGEDPALEQAVADLAAKHAATIALRLKP